VDITVTPGEGGVWHLTDLLGRSMGHIRRTPPGSFVIGPAGQALETMFGMDIGPFQTLDQALAEIERHTRGVCRLVTHDDP
jgi:hypothetical protein